MDVSINFSWRILRASRSFSNEWPTRMVSFETNLKNSSCKNSHSRNSRSDLCVFQIGFYVGKHVSRNAWEGGSIIRDRILRFYQYVDQDLEGIPSERHSSPTFSFSSTRLIRVNSDPSFVSHISQSSATTSIFASDSRTPSKRRISWQIQDLHEWIDTSAKDSRAESRRIRKASTFHAKPRDLPECTKRRHSVSVSFVLKRIPFLSVGSFLLRSLSTTSTHFELFYKRRFSKIVIFTGRCGRVVDNGCHGFFAKLVKRLQSTFLKRNPIAF